jgi:hypothetical protein
MAGDTVIDARNHLDPTALLSAGLRCEGNGTRIRGLHHATSDGRDRVGMPVPHHRWALSGAESL